MRNRQWNTISLKIRKERLACRLALTLVFLYILNQLCIRKFCCILNQRVAGSDQQGSPCPEFHWISYFSISCQRITGKKKSNLALADQHESVPHISNFLFNGHLCSHTYTVCSCGKLNSPCGTRPWSCPFSIILVTRARRELGEMDCSIKCSKFKNLNRCSKNSQSCKRI